MAFNWKSRKLWGGIVALIVGLLVATGSMGETQAEELGSTLLYILGIFGLYVAGNAAEHAATRGTRLTMNDMEKDVLARALAEAQAKVASPKEEDKDWTDTTGKILKAVAGKLIPFL